MFTLISQALTFCIALYTPYFSQESPFDTTHSVIKRFESGIYVSDWITPSSWEQDQYGKSSCYSIKHKVPQLDSRILQGGIVLTFVKGYQFHNALQGDKPLSLPFYFFQEDENASTPFRWTIDPRPGQLEINIQMEPALEKSFQQAKNEVQYRYFLLDKSFFLTKKLTPQSLRSMSYQQLINILAVAP